MNDYHVVPHADVLFASRERFRHEHHVRRSVHSAGFLCLCDVLVAPAQRVLALVYDGACFLRTGASLVPNDLDDVPAPTVTVNPVSCEGLPEAFKDIDLLGVAALVRRQLLETAFEFLVSVMKGHHRA